MTQVGVWWIKQTADVTKNHIEEVSRVEATASRGSRACLVDLQPNLLPFNNSPSLSPLELASAATILREQALNQRSLNTAIMVADSVIYHPAVSHYLRFVATTGKPAHSQ
jgi:hypothetical protein